MQFTEFLRDNPELAAPRILHAALNSLEDFAYVFDREGRFVYSNQALLTLLGLDFEEVAGKNFHDLPYTPALAERLQAQIETVLSTRQVVKDETEFVSPAGKSGFYEYIFSPVYGADGSVEFVAGTTRDVTARHEAQDEREQLVLQLRAERAKLHYLFSHSPSFVATLQGPDHVFELTNPAYRQLIGNRNVVGLPVREALPEVEGQGFFELLDQVFRSGEAFTGAEVAIALQYLPEGPMEERLLNFVYQPIFDEARCVQGIFAHGVDVTEQVVARKEAEASNKAKDEFLATLSHELRTPLTAITGWTGILQAGASSKEEFDLGLETIARNARSQVQLIEDILDVSRMVAGKMRLETQPVELNAVVRGVCASCLPAAQAKGVELTLDEAGASCLVTGDPVRLQQVFSNLLSNALKFTPPGGKVRVALKKTLDHVLVVVSDTGIGMAPELVPNVFDRFRQADSSSTRSQGGLGLGLAIVRHLAELHGGDITAHSEGLGRGATFTLRLPHVSSSSSEPLLPANVEAASTRVAPPRTAPLLGLNILLVDDQEDNRSFLQVILTKRGARVTSVGSAAEAFAELLRQPPDVLLSDIGMPGEDGLTFMQRVRALPPEQGGHTPAAAITAFARPEDRDKALQSGFGAHLSKPTNPEELTRAILELTGRS